jgi:hypothetical protein
LKIQDRPVDADGEKQDDAGGAKKTEDRQRVGAEQAGLTEYRAQGNAEGRAARDAERIRLNQGFLNMAWSTTPARLRLPPTAKPRRILGRRISKRIA